MLKLTRRLPDITTMLKTGLFINDLSMHDSSRDLVLAGTQQSAELKMALDRVSFSTCSHKCSHMFTHTHRSHVSGAQEQQKSKKLEEIMRQLDVEIRRTDELLYQMIPRSIANRLRRGATAIETCKACAHTSTVVFCCCSTRQRRACVLRRRSTRCPCCSATWWASRPRAAT